MLNNVSSVVGIVVSLLTTLTVIIKIFVFLKQSSVSLVLLSHEERQKQKIYQQLYIIIIMFILSFFIGIGVSIVSTSIHINYSPQKNAVVNEKNDYVSTNNLNIREEQINNVETVSEEKTYKDNSIILSDFILNTMYFVLLLITISIILIVYIDDKKQPVFKKYCKIDRYISMGILLYFGLLVLCVNIFNSFNPLSNNILICNVFFSGFFAITIGIFIYMLSPNKYDDVATVRTYYNGRVVYLFCMKDDLFVAGDSMYASECNINYLIKAEKLDKMEFTNAKNKKDIYLKEDNVTFINLKQTINKNMILRIIAADCKKNLININYESVIEVKLDSNKIKYTIDNDKKGECESKPINSDIWSGNVLFIK